MVRKADFFESEFQRAADVFVRLAPRMAAKQRVHVVIGRPLHDDSRMEKGWR
jgi:hypothetical protein